MAWGRGRLAVFAAVSASALAWGLCFRAHPDPVLPWLSLVPLAALALSPTAPAPGWLGWWHGLVCWLVAIPWIEPTLRVYGQMPGFVSVPLLVLFAAFLGGYHALFVLGVRRCARHAGARAAALLLGPALWVLLEWARSWLFSGFPWNVAGYAAVAVPGALASAAYVGANGLSFLVLLANGAFALCWRERAWRFAAIPAALLLCGLTVAADVARERARSPAPSPRRLPVVLLQPNVAIQVEYDGARAHAEVQRVLEQTATSCRTPGALVVLPESALWPYTFDDHDWLRRALQQAAGADCALLFNTTAAESDAVYYNAALLVSGAGPLGRYDKVHLVPYGEYVPLGGLLPFVSHLARNAGAFTPGERFELLRFGGERLGVAICFEVIFPREVARRVRDGATVLVTITNDAWYGDTAAPWQHLRAAQFRAAETRRPLVRAAITGISAVVDRWGRIERSLGVGAVGALETEVIGETTLTPYARAPWAAEAASALLLLGTIGFVVIRRGRTAR